jgi:hypothetical protein
MLEIRNFGGALCLIAFDAAGQLAELSCGDQSIRTKVCLYVAQSVTRQQAAARMS